MIRILMRSSFQLNIIPNFKFLIRFIITLNNVHNIQRKKNKFRPTNKDPKKGIIIAAWIVCGLPCPLLPGNPKGKNQIHIY